MTTRSTPLPTAIALLAALLLAAPASAADLPRNFEDLEFAVPSGVLAGTFGTTGAVVGAKVETQRDRAQLTLTTDADGPVAAIQAGPTGLSLRF